jgi:hypothetical protein
MSGTINFLSWNEMSGLRVLQDARKGEHQRLRTFVAALKTIIRKIDIPTSPPGDSNEKGTKWDVHTLKCLWARHSSNLQKINGFFLFKICH